MPADDPRMLPLVEARRSGAPPVFEKVGIVGLGLIGGSIAIAARQIWPAGLVIAVDDKDVLEQAMMRHAVDVAADDPVVLAEADLVVLAAPVGVNLRLIDELPGHVRGTAIVTDTGSTKRDIVNAAKRLPARLTFVGGHPLGGAARSGFEHARPDLFQGRPWLFTPPARGAEAALERLRKFVEAMGAVPHVLGAGEHDRLVAYLSQLPQLVVSTLMSAVGERVGSEGLALAGRGLVDTTRLASSPLSIWKDICATNADELSRALGEVIERLSDVRRDLESGDSVTKTFDDANRWREELLRLVSQRSGGSNVRVD